MYDNYFSDYKSKKSNSRAAKECSFTTQTILAPDHIFQLWKVTTNWAAENIVVGAIAVQAAVIRFICSEYKP